MYSMTGYGECRLEKDDHYVLVEVASVNNRHVDVNVSLPDRPALEREVERRIRNRIDRGKIDVRVHSDLLEREERAVDVDEGLIERYLQLGNELAGRHELLQPAMRLSELFNLEGVLDVRARPTELDGKKELILEALDSALDDLIEMRQREGTHLRDDLEERLKTIRSHLSDVRERYPESLQEYRDRLEDRIDSLVTYESEEQQQRLQDEIKMYAEKRDISEEVVRLESHLDQFEAYLQQQGPVGKSLEFLIQELQREINTVGDKANDAKISQWTVRIKSELEKCREQVRNVE